MKTRTKVLMLSACAILIAAAAVIGTMAFLTSADEVRNTFTVGRVSITLDEADVKPDGTYKTTAAARISANQYHLIPGHSYIKDPTVHVDSSSEDCWLFVKVANGIRNIETGNTIAAQMADKGWELVPGTTDVYAYKNIVSAGESIVVFEGFQISGNADISSYGASSVTVKAYAVQADGFADYKAAIAAAPFPA